MDYYPCCYHCYYSQLDVADPHECDSQVVFVVVVVVGGGGVVVDVALVVYLHLLQVVVPFVVYSSILLMQMRKSFSLLPNVSYHLTIRVPTIVAPPMFLIRSPIVPYLLQVTMNEWHQ